MYADVQRLLPWMFECRLRLTVVTLRGSLASGPLRVCVLWFTGVEARGSLTSSRLIIGGHLMTSTLLIQWGILLIRTGHLIRDGFSSDLCVFKLYVMMIMNDNGDRVLVILSCHTGKGIKSSGNPFSSYNMS